VQMESQQLQEEDEEARKRHVKAST
jgi:hypothetical protein